MVATLNHQKPPINHPQKKEGYSGNYCKHYKSSLFTFVGWTGTVIFMKLTESPTSQNMNEMPKIAYSYTRFSSVAQEEGDSVRRQSEAAEKWCKENGYALSTEKFFDKGKSAFKGKHLEAEGDLKRFLSLVEQGTVPRGSVLVLESFDRLSRLPMVKATSLFLELISSGIGIVFTMTLSQKVITADQVNKEPWLLYSIIGEAQRAHEESRIKGERIRAARGREKEDVKKTKKHLMKWCPPWCDFVDGKYVPNQHVKTIKRIFKEYLGGNGPFKIAHKFNEEKVPVIGTKGATQWYKKVIRDFLSDERLIGYADFMDLHNYFPKVIDTETFNAVQARMEQQAAAPKTGGPIGNVRNVFTSVARCTCGSVMGFTFSNKKYKSKTTLYEYLVCEAARTGKKCSYKSISYKVIEGSFINLLDQPHFFSSIDSRKESNESELKTLQGELVLTHRQLAKFAKMFEEEENPPMTLVKRMRELEQTAIKLEQQIKLKSANTERSADFTEWFSEYRNKWSQNLQDKEFRLKLRDYIRSEVKSIVVHPKEHYYTVTWKGGAKAHVLYSSLDKKGEYSFQLFAGHETPKYDPTRIIYG